MTRLATSLRLARIVFVALAAGAIALRCSKEPAESTAPSATAQAAASAARTAKAITSTPFSDAGRRSLRGGSDEAPRSGGTMVQAINAEYMTLNNITRNLGSEETLCRLFLFPSLLDLDPDTLELVPMLAEKRPEMSADRLRYTWTLRRGVHWHRGRPDGTPVEVTTADVEFSWRMITDPKVNAGRARSALGPIASVKALDPYRFVVETTKPFFRTELEFGYNFRLMPAHLCAQDPEAFNKDPLGRAPVGYGPYKFDEWKSGEYLALVRDPGWFLADRMPYRPERMRIHFVRDLTTIPTLFLSGALSIAAINDCDKYEELRSDAKCRELATFHEYYLPMWVYITWNTLHPAFSDVRVRRAMTLLHPRELVREKVYRGHAEVISGPWPVTAKEYDASIAPLPFDPAAAGELLDAAGWQDHDHDGLRDKDGRPFRFVLKYPTNAATAPAFATGNGWYQQKLKAAGIEMELRAVEMGQLTKELGDHQYDAAMLGWGADPRDDDIADRFHSSTIAEGSNYGSYRSEECDQLLEAFRGEFDEATRVEIAHAIHRRLAEDQPCTFLYNPESLVLVSTKLRNVKLHALGARWFDWWFAE